ncbi:hypothetical protein [Streptomyces sp. NPDC046685]|uniref:hypothetical protein n=1 Tax=Streptomyces sp. NPDC046685 TaxID=3157202 RepID=UPI0033C512A7
MTEPRVSSPEEAAEWLIARHDQRAAALKAACTSLRAAQDRAARARQRLASALGSQL